MRFNGTQYVWVNGALVPWDDATTHVSAHGLHYGSGVFEGIRCYETERGPALFRLDAHLDRLFASAAVYGFEVPFSRAELAAAVSETVRENDFSHCYVRLLCSAGSYGLGVDHAGCPTDVSILAWPCAPMHGDDASRGLRLTVSPWRKFPASSMPAGAKACGQYLNSSLAVRDAKARGYDEALLLAQDGDVAEAASENVFLVWNGRLITNDARSPILMGVTRDSVLRLARDLGIPVEVRRFGLADVRQADELFLTGTAAEVVPVAELDGESIGLGARGPVTSRIQEAFRAAVTGRDARYAHWLAPARAREPSLATATA